ncbi:MAG: phosphotransacetylase family protein [Chloroflexi bacterium]|nr:phosphotransacetylase family protein [Chloroflexota bacterium]
MITLYITSTTPYAGKSALCVGLGRHFQKNGYKLGYMRPLTTVKTRIGECVVDEEANLMRQSLGLTNHVEAIWPVCLDAPAIEAVLRGEGPDYPKIVMDAFVELSKGKDIMILEGGSRCNQGLGVGLAADRIAEMTGAKVLVVAKYDVSTVIIVDDLLADKARLGDRMLGAVLNGVDRQRLDFVQELVVPFLEKRDIPIYGVLPLERLFASVSIGELAEAVQGEIICRPDLADELVENLMVGAMSVDSALTYFRRKLNKAVITGGDRPDIQLAALETSTKCLILTGNLRPNPLIISRAEEAGVAIMMVKHDTMTTVQLAEQVFGKTRFHQEKKIARFESMLAERFDFDRLYRALGLRKGP